MAWAGADDNPFSDPAVAAARASSTAAPAATGAQSNAPSWLRGGQSAAPPPPPPPAQAAWQQPSVAATSSQQAAPPPAPTAAELARQQKVPQLILYMRITNIGLCALLAATSVVQLIGLPSLQEGVLACYIFAFACVLCCFETHLKIVAKTIAANFGFLYNAKGRAIFMLFVGILCFSFGSFVLGIISGIAMMVNGIFNFYVIFRYPEIERDQQRKDLESEGRDFLRANRGNIATAGAEFARNNPEMAAKAASHAAGTYV